MQCKNSCLVFESDVHMLWESVMVKTKCTSNFGNQSVLRINSRIEK